jgi:hypothetical protein
VQAYLQLEALSVEPDYDIAAALLPLSWWCRFYSANEAEGHQKEVYCVTVGAKICESVGAINDATYSGLIKYAPGLPSTPNPGGMWSTKHTTVSTACRPCTR